MPQYKITVEVAVQDAPRVLSLGKQIAEEGGTEIGTVGEALGELLVNAPPGLELADLGCEITRLRVSDGSEPGRETPGVRETLDNWLHDTEHTAKSYLTGGGEGGLAPPGDTLASRRREAADEALAGRDFGDEVVAEADGWDGEGVEWRCTFYVERHGGPSVKRIFVVRFEPDTAVVVEAHVAE